ncbi:MAG TPA: trypsin-like serine protease [Clostridiales bacterium]|nr:trypsin-like serine protease [Clostridiales bacterium]
MNEFENRPDDREFAPKNEDDTQEMQNVQPEEENYQPKGDETANNGNIEGNDIANNGNIIEDQAPTDGSQPEERQQPNFYENPAKQRPYYNPGYWQARNNPPLYNQQFRPNFGQYPLWQNPPAPNFPPQMYNLPANDTNQTTLQFSPVKPGSSEKVSNKGLKVFALILAFVILLSCGITAGYYAGRLTAKPSGNAPAVDLEPKPDVTGLQANTTEYVYQNVKDSVVGIAVYSKEDRTATSQASGVIYSEDGYIVTNDHIYASIPSPQFLVVTSDGSEYKAEFVAGDLRSDIAVLKIDAKGLTPATFGDSRQVIVGEKVIAIGKPNGLSLPSTVTEGIVSAVDRRIISANSNYSMKYIQTDTAINPGSSGGALVNMHGQVIGITSSKMSGQEYDRIGFAIPSLIMKTVVDSLIKNGYVANRAKLGITYTEIDAVTAELNNSKRGLVIQQISAESSLYNKGIKVGDIITHVNDKQITSSAVILDVIEDSKPGDTIDLTIETSSGPVNFVAELIEDKGTSSYNSTSAKNRNEFNFPFGE